MTLVKAYISNKHRSFDMVVGTPTSGSYGDYLLMKDSYRRLDKTKDWRYAVAFSIRFLRSQRDAVNGIVCAYCGKTHLKIQTPSGPEVPKDIRATTDHFVAKSNGGSEFDTDNCVAACYKCNNKKASKSYDISSLIYASEERVLTISKYISKKLGI